MEQSVKQRFVDFPLYQQQQDSSSWLPICSSEASASCSHSPSSVIVSPSDAVDDSTPSECSCPLGSSSLKEHDYIGLADLSSTASTIRFHSQQLELNMEETDLRLGLCLAVNKASAEHGIFEAKAAVPSDVTACKSTKSDVQDTVSKIPNMHLPPSGSNTISWKKASDSAPIPSMNVPMNVLSSSTIATSSKSSLESPIVAIPNKSSAKRLFSDTIAHNNFNVANINARPDNGRSISGAPRMIMQVHDVEEKSQIKYQQLVYWAPPSTWHSEFGQTSGSLSQLACRKSVGFATQNVDSDRERALKSSQLEYAAPTDSPAFLIMSNQEALSSGAPPSKTQAVGWPPVRSYRRNALVSSCRQAAEDEGNVQVAIYVKVNMDGIPIGRKVDLKTYSSYEELLVELEGMFQSPHTGHGVRFLHGREFVLTYEDKEGDWMLVGDVPWGMFINTVRRLRITRGCDTICLGSSTSKNLS